MRSAHSVPQMQGHCGRCKPQSHGPLLRQREVPPERQAGAIRSQELAGELLARGEWTSLLPKRARIQHAGACGQSVHWNAQTRRLPKPAGDPHAEKQTIAVNMARYGGLHKNHQVLGEYSQMICLMLMLGNENNVR